MAAAKERKQRIGRKTLCVPNPKNFRVSRVWQGLNAHALEVIYPDCKNFEGVKILVLPGQSDPNRKVLDPHFSKYPDSPLARFRPGAQGWQAAVNYATSYGPGTAPPDLGCSANDPEPLAQRINNLKHRWQDMGKKGLSPVALGNLREELLTEGLRLLAWRCGRIWRAPLHIDSRGEFTLAVVNSDEAAERLGACGKFGEALAALLARHRPRTGIFPSDSCSPDGGWCHMNHFDVERMLKEADIIS